MKLHEVTNLRSENANQPGFGLILWTNGDFVPRGAASALKMVEVFFDQASFVRRLGNLYSDNTEGHGDTDISQLHDDPKIAAELKAKMDARNPNRKKSPSEASTFAELEDLLFWSDFVRESGIGIIDKF